MDKAIDGVIQRKLALLDTQVGNLQLRLKDVPREEFAADWALRSMTERALQVAAEIIIDVAERIIALKGGGPVASASAAIERLVMMGVLKSAAPYVGIARFRNLIVHQYEEIDPEVLFDFVGNHLNDFRRFRDEIDRIDL